MVEQVEIKAALRGILSRHEGHGQAVTARELAGTLGSNDRAVRLAIAELIREGLPVLSATDNPPGYFIASSRAEWADYDAQLKSRIVEDAKRKRDVKVAVARYFAPAVQEKLL